MSRKRSTDFADIRMSFSYKSAKVTGRSTADGRCQLVGVPEVSFETRICSSLPLASTADLTMQMILLACFGTLPQHPIAATPSSQTAPISRWGRA